MHVDAHLIEVENRIALRNETEFSIISIATNRRNGRRNDLPRA